jgi:hypothetical protein
MVVKILSSSATFNGIKYNFEKLSAGFAELMSIKNSGPLQAMDQVRQVDYKNYLQMLSARNSRIKQPQFHVVISAKGHSHTDVELTEIGHKWMAEMGYGKQPYLIFFHKDTDDNHIHIVSSRINHEGKKISSEFERVRAVSNMNKIMGLDEDRQVLKDIESAKAYRFSTVAQFKMIMEQQGYILKDNDVIKFVKKLAKIDYNKLTFREPDQARVRQLKTIFIKYRAGKTADEFAKYLSEKHGIRLVFHAKDGKPAYGYSIIDHAQKNVFKGSMIMHLKESVTGTHHETKLLYDSAKLSTQTKVFSNREHTIVAETFAPIRINLSADVDDESIHGPRRRRKQKARTNLR